MLQLWLKLTSLRFNWCSIIGDIEISLSIPDQGRGKSFTYDIPIYLFETHFASHHGDSTHAKLDSCDTRTNGVNDMQNLWDSTQSTGFPDANYHVVCHIKHERRKSCLMPRSVYDALPLHSLSDLNRLAILPCVVYDYLWWQILIFKAPEFPWQKEVIPRERRN